MKTQFGILISIVKLCLTIADIVIPPEYTRPYAQYQPVQRQFLLMPHQYRTSEISYGQPGFIPMYLNGPQDSDPIVGSPQNNYVLARYAYPKQLHAVKIGGHSIVHPSYFFGKNKLPSIVHRRFKKSVDNEIKTDFGKTGEGVAVQSDSSLNSQTISNFDESPSANMKKIEDKTNQANQIHTESTTSATLFNLNAKKLNPVFQISLKGQENHKPGNLEESITKLNLPNTQNIVTESSKLENSMDKSNLRNFPDPRPFRTILTTMTKPTQSDSQKEKVKQNEGRDPIIGSAQTGNSDLLIKDHFRQNYPMWSPISNYYQSPLYSNLVYLANEYQPGVYMVSNIMDGCNNELLKTNVDQQSWSQQQIYQDGTNQVTGTISNNGYTYWPQNQQNYLTNYILRYPTDRKRSWRRYVVGENNSIGQRSLIPKIPSKSHYPSSNRGIQAGLPLTPRLETDTATIHWIFIEHISVDILRENYVDIFKEIK
ncbi:hypothetical protein V1478_008225 [Vespula squamosa]|uniref:Uncharacterized protein n=1 Tax=Vespula squamosa TaxID=30214 RepID=A0ABD2AY68_VESSQ